MDPAMNVSIQARVYREQGPRIVQFDLELPDLPSLEQYEITPEQLDALLQFSLTHDLSPANTTMVDDKTLDAVAPRERYQKSMVHGPNDCTACSICLTSFKPRMYVRRLPCGHLFCSKCIMKWTSKHNAVCPTCRAAVQ